MHELSLAQGLMDQLLTLAKQHKAEKLIKVTVLLGPFSGIVADSFDFGFNILKKENEITKDAELVLETPPPEFRCTECGSITSVASDPTDQLHKYPFTAPLACDQCGSPSLSPEGGGELILKQLEME